MLNGRISSLGLSAQAQDQKFSCKAFSSPNPLQPHDPHDPQNMTHRLDWAIVTMKWVLCGFGQLAVEAPLLELGCSENRHLEVGDNLSSPSHKIDRDNQPLLSY